MITSEYWESEFDVTADDLLRSYSYLENRNEPIGITELAKRLIRGRIRYGHDISPTVLRSWTGKSSVKLWDPAGDWLVGDNVIVVRRNSNTNQFDAFVGRISYIDQSSAKIQISQDEVSYACAEPESKNAINWHNTVREVVAKKFKSAEIEDQVTAVLSHYGDRIVSRLVEVLEQDGRFSSINNQWFLNELIAPLSNDQVLSIYQRLIGIGKPMQLDAIKDLCVPPLSEEIDGDFMLLRGLEEHPNLFQVGFDGNNKTWKAILPEPNQMVAQRYAYDPNTFEIICAPGSKLNQQSSQRLQELDLIAHIIDIRDEL